MVSNCWEVKNCGRQPGGAKAGELGICIAAIETRTDGVNHGKNAGRCCWMVAGTLCGGQRQGIFAQKLENCMKCNFYMQVKTEEGVNAAKSGFVLEKLK